MKWRLTFSILFMTFFGVQGQGLMDSLFEDVQYRNSVKDENSIFFSSPKVDFIQIQSSVSDNVKFAIVVYKPEKPSPVLLISHGWHQSVKPPTIETETPDRNFLSVQVDMRGRKYSTGKQDCNGYELYDFYDAYKYVIKHYSSFISDTSQVYYSGGSGGGGNGYAILGKFPDLFCSAVITSGMSDYSQWFKEDSLAEFRDEMIPWIGCTPDQSLEAYASRSGITTVKNILTPVYIVHGETDVRVPVSHARNFVRKAERLNKEIYYLELKNVGTRNHWGNITKEQEKAKDNFLHQGLIPRDPPELPDKGRMIVPGYIVTKKFTVFLDSINSVGIIKYNVSKKKIKFLKGKGQIKWNM